LSQFKSVAHLSVIGDVHTVSAFFSKEAQSDVNLVLDVPTFQEKAKARFRKLRTSLGPIFTRRLSTLKERKLSMAEAGKPDRVLAIAADDSSDSDGEEVEVAVLALRGASDVKKRPLGLYVRENQEPSAKRLSLDCMCERTRSDSRTSKMKTTSRRAACLS
jgi:hypothetical protein